MKLQNICDQIRLKYNYSILFYDELFIQALDEFYSKNPIIDDGLLKGIDLNIFDSIKQIVSDPLTILYSEFEPIIVEPEIIGINYNMTPFASKILNYASL